ncbi:MULTISPECIES: cell division protein FtsL [Idiomarinaceae]|uniref:Cell division protein FtsL n=3 Tax=Pseudidiomarina TaxID=2800384 RepID=A0A368UVR1_9GAMM|nr:MULTISPECIES: cell division protein FtsL [Idiomarinaceae]MDT7525934.1 cell division protein FtsL [Pseudidiomarina sp. GXY010]MDX1525761.1 cell division protein FtsL [Pseudidiomarina maritima]MRJ41982.1 cell division protein FtsL [Idiomarina sp. FeN1]NCU57265.1 cell division protein FtsL [Idiomarina sp. FenA--70]NCU59973.1 cell division protein FtsL [Idiomarina sp. FenBw--71]
MKASRVPALSMVIVDDLRQHLLLVLLFLALVASALAVIYVAHGHRLLVTERDQLLSERDQIDIEWRHLQIEQNTLTEHSRVERIAVQQLEMVRPQADEEVLVPWH